MPSFQVWDRLRAYFKRANIYRTDNLYQDQHSIDKVLSGGNIIDFSKQSAILEQTNLQINRLERYKDFDMMDEVGEITLALDTYADEGSLVDAEVKHSVIVKANNSNTKKIIEDFLYDTLLIDNQIRPIMRYLCKFGDFAAEIVPTKNRDGVSSFRFINIYNFTRVQTKFGDLVGFFYQDPASSGPQFLHPWQVMHLRLVSFDNVYWPYGRSILDGSRKDFKRLRLMEDAALIYRITRAPEKRIFSIPVGNIPPQEVPQYIELIARQFKKHKIVDPSTGSVNERYSPLIQEDDFFLPKRPDGAGPTIDTLPGAENLDAIADIEYFKKKMVAGLKIPFSRLGIGGQHEPDGKSLAQVSPEFAKSVQWIQNEVVAGLKKIVVVHLALRGHHIDDIKGFNLHMTSASAIDELYRIEAWNTRADIMANIKDIGWFPPEWIISRFTDMSPDEIRDIQNIKEKNELQDMLKKENLDSNSKKLMQEYISFLDKQPTSSNNTIKHNGLTSLVNSNELDYLPSPKKDTLTEDNGSAKFIVSSNINTSEAERAKILIGDILRASDDKCDTDVEEIAEGINN